MSRSQKLPAAKDLKREIAAGREKILAQQPEFRGNWLLVHVPTQRLLLLQGEDLTASWSVSTAAAGVDNRQDSGGTPPGLHRIDRKIGAGSDLHTIFSSRRSTGILWRKDGDESSGDDLILTRILTLDGLEEGVNRGPGVDSRARYIYIHGTNHEEGIGTPVSGGCVRMTNPDVVALFELVEEGDPVVIL
ncbi:MAG: L,D-transpeptidase [Candidatus Krumholzibacteriota bacterium]